MKTTKKSEPTGKVTASLVSLGGLILVWSIVWANLPSKQELLSTGVEANGLVTPAVPVLDLTIPGVRPYPQSDTSREAGSRKVTGSDKQAATPTTGAFSVPSEFRAKKIAEVKCDAAVQQMCPGSLAGENRQRCVTERMKQLPLTCQQIVRQRLVRWKEAVGYKAACLDDVKQFCQGVKPGNGQILGCLQEREQDLSESCYQSLPKGHLLLRN